MAACGGPSRTTYVEPPAKVDLEVVPGIATVTWTPGLNAQSVLIARTNGDVDATPPDGGGVGDPLGQGLIRYVGEDTRYVDSNLPDTCGPFAWHLWSRAADGTWAKSAATVRSLRGAHTLAPTAQVTDLFTTFEGSAVKVQWTPPDAATGFSGVVVLRKVGSAPTSLDDGTRVYAGPSATFSEPRTNLSSAADTYYAVFNCNACGKCATGAPSVAVPASGDGGVTLDVTALTSTLSTDGQTLTLSWTSAAPRVKVVRTLNRPATGPSDTGATVLFDGAGSTTSERVDGLLPNLPLDARTYTYTAYGCLGATCSTTPATTTRALTLRQALRGGGYTLFFRHATAGTCADRTSLGTASTTSTPDWWKSCSTTCATANAEQLTPSASDPQLANVRAFFQAGDAQVSRVLSSEFCRAVQTAQGFALSPVVEQVQQLTYFVYDEPNRCRDTMSLLNARPAMGTNVVHVGHVDYSSACPVLDSLNPAEAVIYKPQLGAPPRYVTRVADTQWAGLP